MSDRELLELAAKAAGYVSGETFKFHPATGRPMVRTEIGDQWGDWRPLTDDGDALRLAVKMGFRVEARLDGQVYVWLGDALLWNEFALHEDVYSERCAAVRRAIVRAAAEIGKAMP